MTKVRVLALSGLQEQWRNRAYQVAMLFGGVMLYLSVLLGMLAVDQELRALLDFGLSFIELMAIGAAIFASATGILREMETKSIYLILSRPVTRLEFLVGRYLGIVLSMTLATLLMAAVHVSLLKARGWGFQADYLLALLGIVLKLGVATAIATFFALFSTSALSALGTTAILWTLGHFIPEMRFLAQRGSFPVVPLLVLMRLLPNLQLFNFRDRLEVPESVFAGEPVALAVVYAVAYSSVCIALAYALIRRKDF